MANHNPAHILCIEDDQDIAHLIKTRLEQFGYLVDLANNGQQGLELYHLNHYNLVVVDQNMPVMDGLTVLKTLAAQDQFPPAIMVTGSGDEKTAVDALKLGASDYLIKDVAGSYLELLPTVIEQVLRQQQLMTEKQQALAALEQRNHDLALLNQAGQTFTATLDLQQLTRLLLQTATQLVNAQGSSIWLWDNHQPSGLVCQIVYNQGEHHSPLNLRLKPGEGVAGWVAQTGQSLVVTNTQTDPRFTPQIDAQTGFKTRSLITVPLLGRESLVGVLEIVNKQHGVFDANDLNLVEALAAPAAFAINNAYMVEALRQRAIELQERNEELDAFAHTVAHDLKSPLVSIVGYSEVVNDFYDSLSVQEIRQNLQVIMKIGRKMDNIIHELLLLAGVRQQTVDMELLDMTEIVHDAWQRLADLTEENNVQLTMPDEWPPAWGYAPWIEEVWVNYLSNAIKYGGTPPLIQLGAETLPNTMVRFWVHDNGPGLSPEQQSRLFTPFTRLSQVRAQGYGLGLSIVHRIIEKLKGQVGVESTPGQGSTFYFTLYQPPTEQE